LKIGIFINFYLFIYSLCLQKSKGVKPVSHYFNPSSCRGKRTGFDVSAMLDTYEEKPIMVQTIWSEAKKTIVPKLLQKQTRSKG
jgi:hypothetical protein